MVRFLKFTINQPVLNENLADLKLMGQKSVREALISNQSLPLLESRKHLNCSSHPILFHVLQAICRFQKA
jgi:hypothetical protein